MRKSVSIGVFIAAVGVAGLGARVGKVWASTPQKTEVADVKIDNFTFGPVEVRVQAGTTITWTNRDDIPHTVVSPDKVFKSRVLDTDEKFSSTFPTPGTFPYFCSIHPKMTGKVIVQ